MPTDKESKVPDEQAARRKTVLELCFIFLMGLAVLGAFVAALNYDFVSARAPLVIMVPLLLLIAVQFNQIRKRPHASHFIGELRLALTGKTRNFNSVAGFIGVMILLLLLIYFAGHYIGISIFMFMLLRYVSAESWLLSLLIAAGVTAIIFVLFEYGFNIELYRGYVFRLFSDY